ncbi:MAG TPA: membrane dipeptidase [Roseiflexaceae bacterium]|nr:membrane dipeptidase [Roseiflexaceae bacterium]
MYRRWSEAERAELDSRLSRAYFLPNLSNHGQARNLTRKLIERGFADEQIAQILYGNWMRVFEQVLTG